MTKALATLGAEPVIRLRADGSREIVDHEKLLVLFTQVKAAEKYLESVKEEIRAAVEECGSETLEIVEESGGREFTCRAPLYEELPDVVREVITDTEYDAILRVSVADAERAFSDAWKAAKRGTKKEAAELFRGATRHMVEAKPPRKRLRERRT